MPLELLSYEALLEGLIPYIWGVMGSLATR